MNDNYNDVTEAFAEWLQPLSGKRRSGNYVDGRWQETISNIDFLGVVQNTSPDDLKVVPEGLRTEESIKIHSKFRLVPQIKSDNTGDIISYKEEDWLVVNVANRYIGGYFKAICSRKPR